MHAIEHHLAVRVTNRTSVPPPPASLEELQLHASGHGYGALRHDRLSLEFLDTAAGRRTIAGLRRHAPMGVEDDLGCGLFPFESQRDEVGAVTAMFLGPRLVATLRLVPSGHGLTAAERMAHRLDFDRRILGPGNWELGRLIVAPEFRHPELLARCLKLALVEMIGREHVEHVYALSKPSMGRLWRRFGYRTVARPCGASGAEYVLVAAHVDAIAAALHKTQEPAQAATADGLRPCHAHPAGALLS